MPIDIDIKNETEDKKVIGALKNKVSHLRVTVYIFVAMCVLSTSLIIYWLAMPSGDTFETAYSRATETAKASLYLSPKQGFYGVGEEFTVDILINTGGNNVVAAAAHLSFNKDKIKAISIDTTDSVFDMQAEKVTNNDDGKIKVTMGKPTPGIRDHAGLVAKIYFKALEKTDPVIDNLYFDFTKGSSLYSTIILDDMKGTNILRATRGTKIIIE
jgi:hypothetical protein